MNPDPKSALPNPSKLDPNLTSDLRGKLDYAGYLHLDRILSSQEPRSPQNAHDELLFIIQHQTSELWFKLMIHEIRHAIGLIQEDNLEAAFKDLARVKHIQTQLVNQWSVLATLTPNDYATFRPSLGPSSGFQSHQNRLLEFLLGYKNAEHLKFFDHRPEIRAELDHALRSHSLYDEFLRYLARRGHAIPKEVLDADPAGKREPHPGVIAVFKTIYQHPEQNNWDAYEMAEKLLDIDETHAIWRYRHYLVVRRIIGLKRGTGGSSGSQYLQNVVSDIFFPELWNVRTEL